MRFDLPKTKTMKVFAYEMQIRRQLGYTPYYFTVGLNLSHKSEEIVMEKSHQVMEILHSGLSDQVQILGPTPKPIARTHNLYHYQIIVKYRFEEGMTQVLNQILEFTQEKATKIYVLVLIMNLKVLCKEEK